MNYSHKIHFENIYHCFSISTAMFENFIHGQISSPFKRHGMYHNPLYGTFLQSPKLQLAHDASDQHNCYSDSPLEFAEGSCSWPGQPRCSSGFPLSAELAILAAIWRMSALEWHSACLESSRDGVLEPLIPF